VPEARTDYGGDYHVDRQRLDISFWFALLFVDVIQNLLADQKSSHEQYAVPTQRKR
jgi:hypothetical protein